MGYNYPQRICKISTQIASGSGSLSFTSGFSNFSTFLVKIRTIIPATDNVSLLMTYSTDGGISYLSSNYNWGLFFVRSTPAGGATAGAATTSITISTVLGNSSSRGLNGDIMLYGLNQSTYVPKCTYHVVSYNTSALSQVEIGGGMNTGTTAVNAIKFAMSSGNITSGGITLYGINDGGFLY